MGHDHSSHVKTYGKAFAIGIGLNIAYVIIEVLYGLAIDSSALLADAGHNASDVLSLVFAWFAMSIAQKRPAQKYTYGLRRSTILVSILNALLLFGAAGVIGWEAWNKLYEPVEVPGTQLIIVASIGIVINTLTALLFIKGQKKDLNIKGAFLHMAADAGVSVGVVAAGLLINTTGYHWIDPVTSFLILLIILYGTWQLFIDSLNLALDAVPKNIDYLEVERFLSSHQHVRSIHDLHIWAMSTTENVLSVHLVVAEEASDDLLKRIKHELHDKFGITHTTIQLEQSRLDDSLSSNE
ncbi:cation diffusion facilitator family transporter [Fodinibius sediminis]|uniref:Cobalt-zinc-cadmium efflux system protein n=1 Tax=Fodinibius sediminis TaxID=1214077 RepID=A0A521BJV0_9BACT|nr:cation diffusion facilitator family transporter [Fodinibius sediminis]SMO47407.1 cobalt-zinc-cadmium efflux system protein [Fodinibius sediminis]